MVAFVRLLFLFVDSGYNICGHKLSAYCAEGLWFEKGHRVKKLRGPSREKFQAGLKLTPA